MAHLTRQPRGELAANDLTSQHRAFMYQRRQARVARVVHGPWQHEYTPGLHTLPDSGGHVLATETALTFTDATGKITQHNAERRANDLSVWRAALGSGNFQGA